jgi:hypothetical protein
MPDPKTTAAPKPRKPRATWTHVEVANLLTDFHAAGLEGVETRADPTAREPRYGLHDADSAKAKLIELGLVAKPEKPVLGEHHIADVEQFVKNVAALSEVNRILSARLAIAKLRELLPKRERNGGGT